MNKLRMVGTGLVGIEHLTFSALSHLKASKHVLLFFAPEGWKEVIQSIGKSFEEIDDLYRDGAQDLDNYDRIEAHVYESLALHHDVALCIPGHPRVGVTITGRFDASKSVRAFELAVVPAISSFDTMINDLELDPLRRGASVVDANLLILFDYNLEPAMDHFIYHVCSIGTSKTHISDATKESSIEFLKEKLLRHYATDHIVKLVRSRHHKSMAGAETIDMAIGSLEQLLPHITFSSTLYVPAASLRRERLNTDFLARFHAPANVE